MGYPEVQDGQARRVRADTGVPSGPGADEIPDAEAAGYGFPASSGLPAESRGSHRAAEAANAAAGPAARAGAHRAGADNRPGPARPSGLGADGRPRGARPPAAGPGDHPLTSRAPGAGPDDRSGGRGPGAGPGNRPLPPRGPGGGTTDRTGSYRSPGGGPGYGGPGASTTGYTDGTRSPAAGPGYSGPGAGATGYTSTPGPATDPANYTGTRGPATGPAGYTSAPGPAGYTSTRGPATGQDDRSLPPRGAGGGATDRTGTYRGPAASPADRSVPSQAPGSRTAGRGGSHRSTAAGPGERPPPSRAPGQGADDPGSTYRGAPPARGTGSAPSGPAGPSQAGGPGTDGGSAAPRGRRVASGARAGLPDAPGEAFGPRRASRTRSSRGGDPGLRGPIRGFPPLPGQADPVYPPGQFSSWNRASTRAAWLGMDGPGAPGGEAEPGYSALAVSDPSADATSTQTWEAIDDGLLSDGWAPVRADRDWGSHTGDTRPVRQRTADGRPASPGQPAGPGRGLRGHGRGARAAQPAQAGPAAAAPASAAPPPAAGGPASTPAGPAPTGLAPAAAGPTSAPPVPPQRTPVQGTQAQGTQAQGTQVESGAAEGAPAESIFAKAAAKRARRSVTQDGDAEGGRRSRAAGSVPAPARRAGKPGGSAKLGKRHHAMMAALLLAPVIVVILVAAGYVYLNHKPAPAAAGHPAPSHHAAAPLASPSPTLGPWKHIESRALDPTPLGLTELFPAQFSTAGQAGVRTVDKASTNCPREVFGSKLASAVRKADCTQVLRASYLSTDHKIMATVGVLNLTNVTAAEDVGKVSGSDEFIKQLPAAHGPTRNLSKGTGIVEAEFKGHYLILIWTEFANLNAPQSKSQRKKLETFSQDLIAGTANISLTNRMVNGRP